MRELLLRRRQLLMCGKEKDVRAVCFEADGDQTVSLTKHTTAPSITMQYSYDGISWQDWDLSVLSFGGSKKVYVRGVGNTRFASSNSYYYSFTFGTDALVYASGILETLLDWETEVLSYRDTYVFCHLFYGQTALCSVKDLIFSASNITERAYYGMFYGCTSLLDGPESLPATTLANACYYRMFEDCSRLTTAPKLPATTLTNECYFGMFWNCSSLTAAPKLPATTLANSCYSRMFEGCSKLTTAPESLPATTLQNYCYNEMFYGCSSLTAAPKLPATTLANSCYFNMFYGCKSLTAAPELPATTLADKCYGNMFCKCSKLTTAPKLPATTLANRCYDYMFCKCSKLTTAPKLPATTLTEYCYRSMFEGCSSLTSAPELPATTLAPSCYSSMFYGCSKINSIRCRAQVTASSATSYWLYNVATSGTFYGYSKYKWTSGPSGKPSKWKFIELTD